MAEPSYPFPVSKLLTLGDCHQMRGWPDYLRLGLAPEHIPDLIRMALDDELHWYDSDSAEAWAPEASSGPDMNINLFSGSNALTSGVTCSQ